MGKQPPHRPERSFPNAKRIIVECELSTCIYCGEPLKPRKPWHMRKTVQTLKGCLFVAGRSKQCDNPQCPHVGQHYYASSVWKISLPYGTYGLDVLAHIGWQHEKEHRQLAEIQRDLSEGGMLISERTVGRLYRQFLALLGGASKKTLQELEATAKEYGGLIWAIDALKPDGHGTWLYVLYEVLKGTPVSALQSDHPTAEELGKWLKPYRDLPYEVLATLSDGEDAIIAAFEASWPNAAHQRCQEHALGNIVEPVLKYDARLRQQMRQDLGGLPAVPELAEIAGTPDHESEPLSVPISVAKPVEAEGAGEPTRVGQAEPAPPFYLLNGTPN